jgi:uncharacterized repeat protein (TIGR02543 family)
MLTVTLDATGGTLQTSSPLSVAVGKPYGPLPTPTQAGWEFIGWYTAQTEGSLVTETTVVSATSDHTLYAHWEEITDDPTTPPVDDPTTPSFVGEVVTLSSCVLGGGMLDITGKSAQAGTSAIIWDSTQGANQRFRILANTDGTYRIESVNTPGMVLDIYKAQITNGTAIIQWPWNNSANQKWRVIENTDGSITFASALNPNYAIDVYGGSGQAGTKLILWQIGSNKPNQAWRINEIVPTVTDGIYTIRTAGQGARSLDIEGASTNDGARMLLWDFHGGANQQFILHYVQNTGYYTITNVNSGKSVDVFGGSVAQGTQIIQWPLHGKLNQQWALEPVGNGTYRITGAANGLSLDVYGGNVGNNGRIISWPYHGGANQRWLIEAVS